MQKVFINICEERLGIKTPVYYQDSYKELFQQHNIIIHTYYIGKINNNESYLFQESFCCHSEEDLINRITLDYKNNDVVYINTAVEGLIELSNKIKRDLGEPITKHASAFRDKSLQRDLLALHNQELAIKYFSFSPKEVNIEQIEAKMEYPFIIKPSSGIQSAGVSYIGSRLELETYLSEYNDFLKKFSTRAFDKNLLKSNSTLVCEEFLDGEMFSVDYFVDKKGKITITPPVEVKIGQDIGIDDFMNYARSFRSKTLGGVDAGKLQNLIQTSVDALGISNIYIHHEFKITSKNKFKTIEINGRIGGYRPEMIQEALEFNWFSAAIGQSPDLNLKHDFCSFAVYPTERGVLKGFNHELFSKIEKLNSIYVVNKIESFIGSEIGLTSQGFTKVAVIKIKNSNITQFEKDYHFIEKNFKKLLILK